MTFVGWSGTWNAGSKKVIRCWKMKHSDIIENARKRMKNLHNWFKAVDQLVISVAKIFELVYVFLKEPEDIIGGLAILEFLGKWILGQVYSGVLAIASQGCIENDFKVGRGDHCRGHETKRKCWGCVGRWRETEENPSIPRTRIGILGRTGTSIWGK